LSFFNQLKGGFMKIVYWLLATLLFVPTVSHALDQPDIVIPKGIPKMTVAFADPQIWDGKWIPKAMQCPDKGGVAPIQSPALKISGAPVETKKLIVFFEHPAFRFNHGLFTYAGEAIDGIYSVPAVRAYTNQNLPVGVEAFQGGSGSTRTPGAVYVPSCAFGPGMNAQYVVKVYALDANQAVIAQGEQWLGYAKP
jgi:hypothetical protein